MLSWPSPPSPPSGPPPLIACGSNRFAHCLRPIRSHGAARSIEEERSVSAPASVDHQRRRPSAASPSRRFPLFFPSTFVSVTRRWESPSSSSSVSAHAVVACCSRLWSSRIDIARLGRAQLGAGRMTTPLQGSGDSAFSHHSDASVKEAREVRRKECEKQAAAQLEAAKVRDENDGRA